MKISYQVWVKCGTERVEGAEDMRACEVIDIDSLDKMFTVLREKYGSWADIRIHIWREGRGND